MMKRLAPWLLLLAASSLQVVTASGAAPSEAAPPRLELRPHDRIVIVGNTFAERMQQFGNFETLLYSRFPTLDLVVRDLGWSADELTVRMRSAGFDDHGHKLEDHKPTVLIACFGFNESFHGPAGLEKFERDLDKFLEQQTTTSYDGVAPPRVALISPIAHENLHRRTLPDGSRNNENLQLYTKAMAAAAARHGVVFVDLFTPTQRMAAQSERPWTFNGIHLTAFGDEQTARLLDEALFGARPAPAEKIDLAKLHEAVNEKNRQFWYDYRAVNGCYIYGGRKAPFGVVNFPPEFAKLRRMIDNRDHRIWDIARGRDVPAEIDDSNTGEIPPVETNYNDPIVINSPADEKAQFELPAGYEATLFASEVEFPDLKKPVQFEFDSRGRMWVVVMPSYPMYLPGNPVNDKLLILEDTDADGKADKQTVYAEDLYLPTGLELGDGGAYIAQQPNLLFVRDTDGDDHADQREVVLHGFDSGDSHHAINAFTWGPDGALYMMEGTFHQTQIETPYGPQRVANAGIFRYEPLTAKVDIFVSYPFANPWGEVFDRWGQYFVADASPGANYFGTAFSGQVDFPQKHGSMQQFLKKEWRPTSGCELVRSRHFPDDVQNNYLLNNCIGFQGVLNYKMREVESGFAAQPVAPLLRSKDFNCRPVDLKFGPDGALYVIDWFNPLIGHMQHSIRDPHRDKTHGRIWRITYKDRPLAVPPRIAGATIPELLELLKSYEDRTLYRVRRELRTRDTDELLAAVGQWIAPLSAEADNEADQHMLLEALWIHQQHDEVNEKLLKQLLRSPDYRTRAAATRVLCYWRDRVGNPLELLLVQATDPHPRVRLEAARAASFFDDPQAIEVALATLAFPQDGYLKYTVRETRNTLEHRAKERGGATPSLARLLQRSDLPADRLPNVLRVVCESGSEADMVYIFSRAVAPDGFTADLRRQAFEGITTAARTRKLRPAVDAALLEPYLADEDRATRQAAIEMVAALHLAPAAPSLERISLSPDTDDTTRRLALEALASLDHAAAQQAADKLLASDNPRLRAYGVLTLTAVALPQAADRAAALIVDPAASSSLDVLLAGFLDRKQGAEILSKALADVTIPADSAKLAVRQMFAAGRGEGELATLLTKAAGLGADVPPPTPDELRALIAEVAAHGDATRGEVIFRRAELGCMKCHALSGAGGDIGPDLSALGATSPVDYCVTSVVQPDLNVKEAFLTRYFVTNDGMTHQGIVVDRDERSVVIKDAAGVKITIPAADIEEEGEGKSLMPKGLSSFLTHAEFLDLMRFLSELGKPGDFAVRTQQTIQRWRVAPKTPNELAKRPAADKELSPRVVKAAVDEGLPAYATVGGRLPLAELAAPDRKVLCLSADVEVTEQGPLALHLDDAAGVTAWVDRQPISPLAEPTPSLAPGRHKLIFRVDTAARKEPTLRVVVDKPADSPAAYTVVGGP